VTTYIKKIRAGLVPNASVDTYVGDPGTIFYDPAVGAFHLSDGVNPGGTALVTAGGGGGSGDSLVNGDSSFSMSSDGTLTLTHPAEPALHPLATVLTVQKAAGNYHTISGAYGLSLQATPVPSGFGLNTNTNFVDIFHDGISVNVNDNTWTFGTDGNLTLPEGGDIVDITGNSVLGGSPDGGLADNSAGLTITTYSLSATQYDTSGSVTYNIASAGASAAGIIIKGLTVNHTQVISGSFNQGSNTVNWNDYTISGTLWNQVASVTAFVTDSRGYTFLALVTDMWEVPHGPCLVEGTLITMADGTHRTIEDISHGELIRVWNFDLGEFSEAQPIWIKLAEETDMHDVYTFSDGTKLRTVGHHVFNKEAGAFTKFIEDTTPVGTTTFNEQGLEVILVSKERVVAPTRYYNIWTQYHLNLFANGILTSNRFNNIYPIVDMKFVKDDRALRSVDEFASIDEKYITGLRLQEQSEEYTAEYIADYVHNRLERLDIANQVAQGI